MKRSIRGREASRSARLRVLAGVAVGAVLVACDAGPGDRAESSAVEHAGPGETLYVTYCQSCHGESGRGDGPAAARLRTPPTDLTRLWMRYGTPLDRQPLAEYVDGRWLMFFHGPREMPIWGDEIFGDMPEGTPGLEELRKHLIELLVEHLQTLQSEQQA